MYWIFFFGNLVKIPESSKFRIFGTLILNGDDVVVTVPVLTPTTFTVDAKVSTLPSAEIFVIWLNVGST